MGFFQQLISNPAQTISNTVSNVVSNPAGAIDDFWSTGGRDFAKAGAAAAAAYYGGPAAWEYLTGAGAGAGAAGGSWVVPASGGAAEWIPAAGAGGAGAAGAAGASNWMTPAAILGSSLLGAGAAQQGANTQANAQMQANQLMYQQYLQQRADLAPFTGAGIGAQNKLLTYLGLPGGTQGADYGKYAKDFGMTDFTTDPGYAFRLSEGQKALDRSAAARGGLISGGALKAAERFGQDLGSQEYQSAFNRYQTNRANQLAPLASLMGSGQASAAGQAAAAGNYGAAAGAGLTNIGAATAAGGTGTANALAGGVGQYLNYAGQQDQLAAYNARTAMGQSMYKPV
jgi:hypothetical protein